VFLFIAPNLEPLTSTFCSHEHKSSTVPLSIPTLLSTHLPHTYLFPIPSLENFMSGDQVNMSFCYNVIIRHNITCTAIICQLDLCCTVTCLRHYTHISRLHVVIDTIYNPTLPHISNTIYNSSSHFPCTVL
jgi:hypothetical protein